MMRLLSTDFDGTLVPADHDCPMHPGLVSKIRDLRARGAIWVINTGRSLQHTLDGIRTHAIPEQPDFLLTSERDIFQPGGTKQWRPFGDWNERCEEAHESLFSKCAHHLHDLVEWVRTETRAYIEFTGQRLSGFVATSEPELARIAATVDEIRSVEPLLHYQRNSVYLRLCHSDYHKGAALGELQRLLGITPGETFAAGDNHNDLSMLDPRWAAMLACPSNAIAEVKTSVRAAGGYVATRPDALGVLDALGKFGR